jgi:Ca-activated chloride channel family protein
MKIDPRLRGWRPDLDPRAPFSSPDGRIRGWKVTVPGRRPLATPAVVGGRVFLGGGFGSFDFYAFDAVTGNLTWHYQTTDDGPTAAVVADGHVAFNTESCELEVLTIEGRPVWKKWLGDPLMSMPAADRGRVYMAHPDNRGDREHYLACFGLTTGREFWKRPITGEVITAPVLAEGRVYLATLDGTLYCFRQDDGHPEWREPKNATSSPVVWQRQCFFSQRREAPPAGAGGPTRQTWEHVVVRGEDAGAPTIAYGATARAADYLDPVKRRGGSPYWAAHARADARVGFSAHKGAAKMDQALRNLGRGQVASVWAYQGSKPFLARGRLYVALGDTLHCLDPRTGEVLWERAFPGPHGRGGLLDGVLTPAAIVNDKIFLGTLFGDVYCLSARSGETLWSVSVGEPVVFQPAVALGRVYIPTHSGSLYCLETGDAADDGWLMWGATASHNGRPE